MVLTAFTTALIYVDIRIEKYTAAFIDGDFPPLVNAKANSVAYF